MKPLISLIFLSIICSSLSVSLNRVKKSKSTVNSKSKSEGSGDYKTGYVIPGIQLAAPAKDFGKTLVENAKFKPVSIETPATDDDKLGWAFELTADPTDADLKKFMFKGKTDKTWYIPYRFFSKVMEYNNPYNNYKTITGELVNDEKEVYRIRILLPYKTIGWYISDDEANKIIGNVNINRIKAQANIKNGKSAVNTAAVSYTTNKPLLDSAKAGVEKLNAEKAKLKTDLETFKKDSQTKQTDFDSKAKEIATKETELNTLKTTQNNLGKEISTIGNQIENIQKALSVAEANTDNAKLQAEYEKTIKKNTDDLEAAIKSLKDLAPQKAADLDSAKTAVISSSDLKTLNTNLAKVAPA